MRKVEKLAKEINGLLGIEFDNLQDWRSLYRWKLGESRLVGDIIATKVMHQETHMRFYTRMPPMSKFPEHWHDATEVCTILGGALADEVTNSIWHANEKAVFSPGKKHIPVNPSLTDHCFLIVDFYKV